MAATADNTGAARRSMTWPQVLALVFGAARLTLLRQIEGESYSRLGFRQILSGGG